MDESPRHANRLIIADMLMVMLCSVASFWVLASPLVPYVFDIGPFLVAYVLLTIVLASTGVKLNHMASRNTRITFGRGRRRS